MFYYKLIFSHTGLIDLSEGDPKYKLVVTPSFIAPINTCSVTISSSSVKFKPEKLFSSYKSVYEGLSMKNSTFKTKNWISLEELKTKEKARLSFLFTVKANDDFELLVVFNMCARLVRITGQLPTNLTPQKDRINLINHDKCDFEYRDDKRGVNCNWKEAVLDNIQSNCSKTDDDQSKAVFKLLYETEGVRKECTKTGVRDKNSAKKHFLKLHAAPTSGEKFTTAYLASPTFNVDNLSLVGFSMHYSLHCAGSTLNAYLAPERGDIFQSLSEVEPFIEIQNDSYSWQFMKKAEDVSNLTGFYRVICLFYL